MTLVAVPILVNAPGEVEESLARARAAADRGARLVEWRVDAMAGQADGERAALELVRRSPVPCIVTCRAPEEGGTVGSDERERIDILEAVTGSEWPPKYVDVEHACLSRDTAVRDRLERVLNRAGGGTALIASSHDLQGRPADLIRRIEALTADPDAAVIKIAWRARSVRDNLEAFDLLAERRRPMIALCMGEFGLLSRVLAPKFGGLVTFAADAPGAESAPGQPTLETLRDLYRFDEIAAGTRVYGVIGWPVGHSMSPHVHNAGFSSVGHDGVYLPLPVPPEWEHFKATAGALIDHARLGFAGASITIPHKEHLVRFVRERGGVVDPVAARLGAANTLVVREDGALECANTDGPAAVEALCAALDAGPDALAGRRVAVLGAGGVARAVVGSLAAAGAKVVIFNRTEERAAALARELGGSVEAGGRLGHVARGGDGAIGCGSFDIFVNCTPLGMTGGPDPDASPLPDDVPLEASTTVFDTVYNPFRTPLLRRAEARGARVVPGMEMFVRQAAMQFEMWTGKKAPIDVFRKALEKPGTFTGFRENPSPHG